MARKNTSQGPLANRPSAIAATNTYWFDTDANHYYYSDGVTWALRDPDLTEIDPSAEAVVSCGVTPAGKIEPFKVTPEGYQRISGILGQTVHTGGSIAAANVSQLVVPENLNRKYLLVQNTSDTPMYIGIGIEPGNGAGNGVMLPKDGGSLVCDLFIPTQAIKIVCSKKDATYACLEG